MSTAPASTPTAATLRSFALSYRLDLLLACLLCISAGLKVCGYLLCMDLFLYQLQFLGLEEFFGHTLGI
jgi:hypothetical protein